MAINSKFVTLCSDTDACYIRDVLAPIGTELTDIQLEQRINMAWAVTRQLSGKLGDCGGNTTLCEITALLAAHFVTVSERQTKSESVANEWTVEYLGDSGTGLKASMYGQNAIAMDCSGILAELAEGVKRTSYSVYGQYDNDDVTLT